MNRMLKSLYPCGQIDPTPISRREMLRTTGCGFGMVALSAMLQEEATAARSLPNPLAERAGHVPARAKRIIFVFLGGGPSQVDLFQNKPALTRHHGEAPPPSISHSNEFATEGFESTKLQAPISTFSRVGESGIWMSDLLPQLSRQIDQLCFLNGTVADNPAHSAATRQLFCGSPFLVQPSLGAWTSYGLGTENQNLPSFVAMDVDHSFSYGSYFLPAIHQGTKLEGQPEYTIRHLKNDKLSDKQLSQQQELLQRLNRQHLDRAVSDSGIEGLIDSYELAFRMQARTDAIVDLSGETEETKTLYGIGEDVTDKVGRSLLVARRLSEVGVRFVQVQCGGWDHHSQIKRALPKSCAAHDKPFAGLLQDLRRRGLLDDTLVVFAGEFGRTPFDQDLSRGKDAPEDYGRGHSPLGFTTFLSGGGVKGGMAFGETDDLGYRAVDGKVHIHDLHATILHLLGLDHEQLTYHHGGRDIRLTDVYGRVVEEIIA